MDMSWWDIIKTIGGWLGALGAFMLGSVVRTYNKLKKQNETLENRVVRLEIHREHADSRLKRIEEGVDKLVDHLLDSKDK